MLLMALITASATFQTRFSRAACSAPLRQLAAAAPGHGIQHGGGRCCLGRHNTGAARTPRALLRRTPRAAASSLAVLRLRKQRRRYAPCSRFSPRRLPLGCARGHCFAHPRPQGSRKGTLSAQQSADRSTRPDGQVAPASGWAASSFCSPVGLSNEPSLRFGLLALAHPPRRGTRCAAGSARCTDYLNISGQAEGSIVTP